MKNKKVYTFAEYTKENVLKVGDDGKYELQDWCYYKDVYPDKYDMDREDEFTWIIKHKDKKIAVISGLIGEEEIKKIMETIKKGYDDISTE